MAGAMRLGELAHLMEIAPHRRRRAAPTRRAVRRAGHRSRPHRLRARSRCAKGETDTRSPWLAAGIAKPLRRAGAAAAHGARRHARCRSRRRAPQAARRPRAERGAGRRERRARAMLRVRADIDRPAGQRGRRGRDRARARRRRAAHAEGATCSSSPTASSACAARCARSRSRPRAQIQSRMSTVQRRRTEGFDPLEFDRYTRFQELTRFARRRRQRRLDRPAVAAEEPRRRRRRAARAGAAVARRAAAAVRDPHGAVRQPVRAPLPHPAADREASSTSGPTSKSAARRSSSTARCWKSSSARSSTCCATRSTTASRSRERASRPASPKPARSRSTVRQVGNEIAIELADDGAGLDFERVREKARRAGPARRRRRADRCAARRVHVRIRASRTAAEVTQISGRGVGMDVVRNEITALGGRVEVRHAAGQRHHVQPVTCR